MIFSIRHYPTHDGPGIRTIVFLKGCSLGCHWCQNPESRARTQGLLYNPRLCLGDCKLCAKIAPEMVERALNGLFTHREELTPEHFTMLTDCCPTQTLTACGGIENVEEIMVTVLRDKPFYDRSGGGSVFSDGGPFMQPEMAAALLQASHEVSIHTAVETCPRAPWKYIAPPLPHIDLFLADLKHVADASFKQWTDGNVARVLDNLKKPAVAGRKITIRVPLIQGFSADKTPVGATTDLAADELHVSEIHSLPYHTLGINKYHLLNLPYGAPEKPLDVSELLGFAQQYACQRGLAATL